MLSVFPSLLSWQLVAPLIMRLALGAIFIHWAYRSFKNKNASAQKKAIGIVEGISGILLVIGLWTQVAALIAIVYLLVGIYHKISKKAFLTDGVNYYLVLLVIAVSIIVSGAGLIAFDLPL